MSIGPLDWRKTNADIFISVAALAKSVLGIQASPVASEGCLSRARTIFRNEHPSLLDDSFVPAVLFKDWKKNCNRAN